MPLKLVHWLNHDASRGSEPRHEDAAINTDDIVSVLRTEDRGGRPSVIVKLRDGSTMECRGRPVDFIPFDERPVVYQELTRAPADWPPRRKAAGDAPPTNPAPQPR